MFEYERGTEAEAETEGEYKYGADSEVATAAEKAAAELNRLDYHPV